MQIAQRYIAIGERTQRHLGSFNISAAKTIRNTIRTSISGHLSAIACDEGKKGMG